MKIINLSNYKLIKFGQLANKINDKKETIKLNYKLLNNEVVTINNIRYQRRIWE